MKGSLSARNRKKLERELLSILTKETHADFFLLDWGSTVEAFAKDLATVPKEFISIPFYSHLAVLGEIQ